MYILFDIGGTRTRVAASYDMESFGEPVIFNTPKNFEEGIEMISVAAKELSKGETIKIAAGGIAASPNREKTEIIGGGSNIVDWLNKPLKIKLEEAFDCSVYIENDTAMGGLAQVTYGPAQDIEIVVYMTISTGVGGCRLVSGKIDKSAMGFEPGWQIIDTPSVDQISQGENWLSDYCSNGYLMSYIGGTCVERSEGKKPVEITDKDFWDKKAKILAYGLHNICTMWSPGMIVIGGSMMNNIGIPLDTTRKYLGETLKGVFPNKMPRIEPAKFGDEMGLHGSMAYLKQL